LASFPPRWPFPRGDLYHWIPLLNRFDFILEKFNQEYGLSIGPQTRSFGRKLLERAAAEEITTGVILGTSTVELDAADSGDEGDKHLACSTLVFSRMLLENCGNRSLYNSSDRLGDILNTTDLSLLASALHLAVRLAQRYHASRQRGTNASQHLNTALLASHYNIELEKVQKLANPFVKSLPLTFMGPDLPSTPVTPPTVKGKEKAQSHSVNITNPSDMLAVATDESSVTSGSSTYDAAKDGTNHGSWEDWGGVVMRYYHTSESSSEEKKPTTTTTVSPMTPTPVRRPSGLSRQSRTLASDESIEVPTAAPVAKPEESTSGGLRTITIPFATISTTPIEEIIESYICDLPKEHHYELLTRLRTAYALTTSLETRQQILGIRLLAITNLAYLYPETLFQQKILQLDSDEPRRLQMAYQLTDLIHPPGNRGKVPTKLQTLALGTLEAFSKHKTKASDVCAALNINVKHGVLFYALRKAAAELAVEDVSGDGLEGDEWREALCSLLDALPASTPRTGETLIAAGLLEILIEILTLRTAKAERTFPRILTFLNTIIYSVRDAFQTLANSKGLDTISDLIAYEVQSSLTRAENGDGLPWNVRNHVTDYRIPFYQQQTLRWLFKFVNHMMSHGNGNFDRLLRNLIDSSQLLGGLRKVIVNAKIFGSSVWSGAVNIMSAFIHNEPTSYAVIAEAGLSKGFLEAITARPVSDPNGSDSDSQRVPSLHSPITSGQFNIEAVEDFSPDDFKARIESLGNNFLAQGILPATDAIVTIPQAFGAICLNNAGMNLFLKSDALDKFFEIFESPEHVRSMNLEGELARLLGSSFDELVRHHPRLRRGVLVSVIGMLGRVGYLCTFHPNKLSAGAKLFPEEKDTESVDSTQRVTEKEQDSATQPSSIMGSTNEADGVDAMTDVTYSSRSETLQTNKEASSSSTIEVGQIKEDEKHEPTTSTYINVAMKFLAGFFENSNLCAPFIESGGFEFILDFVTIPSLPYDFSNHPACQELARVAHMLAEQKPHLVLPSIVKLAQRATDDLDALTGNAGDDAAFLEYTTPVPTKSNGRDSNEKPKTLINGTEIVKALVNVNTLSVILHETFSQPIFNSRTSHALFSQLNLADMYVTLVKSLGRLQRFCVWEEILLQNSIPEKWREATRFKGYSMGGVEEADDIFDFIHRAESIDDAPFEEADTVLGPSTISVSGQSVSANISLASKKASKAPLSKEERTDQFRNSRTLRFLLSQVPSLVVPFFQALGKSLIAKRRPEAYARQNAYMVAKAISEAVLDQLRYGAPRKSESLKDRFAYYIVILTSISQLIIEGIYKPPQKWEGQPLKGDLANSKITGPIDRPHPHCLILVLQAFKDGGGLIAMNELLSEFLEEVKSFSDPTNMIDVGDRAARLNSAYRGIKIILNFYAQITTSKSILDASQTTPLTSHDRGHMHFFSPSQFLVELRMAVLPVVRSIWEPADFMEKASGPIVKSTIDILRTILEGADEQGAFRRGDKFPARGKAPFKIYPLRSDSLTFLTTKGYEPGLAREALYRCMNVQNTAEEYCRAQKLISKVSPNPIPSYDQEKPKSPSPVQTPNREGSEATIPDPTHFGEGDETAQAPELASTVESLVRTASDIDIDETGHESSALDPIPPPPAPAVPPETGQDLVGMNMNTDNLLHLTQILGTDHGITQAASGSGKATPSAQHNLTETRKISDMVTLNDLDDNRASIKSNLIDRALDVLNTHGELTFELSDLITAAASKPADAASMRREIGEILVQSLISFHMDEDFRSAGKKIAAHANLLALVLQDPLFYEATLDELKSNFSSLLGFIKIFPDQAAEESSPWIGQILLIVEKILAEDVQPSQIQWTPPPPDNLEPGGSVIKMEESLVPMDEKVQLFEAILEILPRIGKDESLVLSVIRTLVILTRNRDVAARLGEKRNIQRLFVMIKQLAGITHERVQSSFMLLLRHIVEDEQIIRQIMRSEIIANFETRPSRTTDTNGYVRQMYHLALRSPKIFVEVTSETLEIAKYDPTQRPQILSLKAEIQSTKDFEASSSNNTKSPIEATKTTEIQIHDDDKPSTTEDIKNNSQKPKVNEIKAPVVEYPSGVIHYLLCELLSYKDVEDKEHVAPGKETTEVLSSSPVTQTGGPASPRLTSVDSIFVTDKKHEKPEFRAEQHPIYIHRCFILQCLAELLHCYNRTKIEFINFSRKADPQAMTPSKPRSGVLNYLLNDVVPVGTLNHDESITFRKKSSMSNWAMSAIVSLCLRTNENGYERKRGSLDDDEETDLVFVRKFVLEHALKAYKDANLSDEPLDVKYARLLSLADLFNRLLSGKLVQNPAQHSNDLTNGPQKTIAKLMFEKNFISALTSSIAEIDLNFPGSRRTVKYILRPLKQLTQTAIVLSETSSISSTPGQTDEDEISTASSVSEVTEEREETPDLFRNSTLGMFEPNREEDSSSESSDGDEDEDMYDEYEEEGLQYGDDMERDGDEVISDEEEIEGVGPMEGMPGDTGMDVEVVIGDGDDEPTDDDDDEDDSDDMDDEDDVEVNDEITGDSENDSLAEGEDEEWRDEDGDEEHGLQDPESAVRDIAREYGEAEAALQHLDNSTFRRDLDGYMEDVARDDDDDEGG
jgi:E3 ubiquitin-protein ligase HUWE1